MQTTTKRPDNKAAATVTRGSCRISCGGSREDLAEYLDAGAALLEIRPEHGGWRYYLTRSLRDPRGGIVGYRLETLVGHVQEAVPIYDIDCSFGGIDDYCECDCPDWVWRRQNTGGTCKHVAALRAALRKPGESVEF